ncbi:MAG TPA: hypothetical protein DCR14_18265, partial [Acidimicrobiaceae bacterium]|nr:hypothetical protein [Acidimicrobiaceae bacterium]
TASGTWLRVPVAGRGTVPATGAVAVAVNVTAVGAAGVGYVTAAAGGAARPPTSTVNTAMGAPAANLAVVPLGSGGAIDLHVSGTSTHLVVDVVGWFGPGDAVSSITPARLMDTRPFGATTDGQHSGSGALGAAATTTVTVTGRGGVPSSGVGAVALNVTLVNPTATTWTTVYPAGRARPTASNLNAPAGRTTAALVMVPVGPGGQVTIYHHVGSSHMVVDVVAWFAGEPLAPTVPQVPSGRPRIYLPSELPRLQAMVASSHPAATRFLTLMQSRRSLSYSQLRNSGYSMWQFALAAHLTGDITFCNFAVTGVEQWVAAEEARIASGGRAEVAGDSYLEVGYYVGDVAMVLDWCHGGTTAAQRARWLTYADQAVWNVWHPDDATWGGRSYPWSGWSIDNPSNNYYYSFLRATMLLGIAGRGELASADGWLQFFRTDKIAGQLVPTFERDLQGGGSREGTGYGTAMMNLWELYDLWATTTGEDISALTGHTRASLVHFLHYVLPTVDGVSLNGDHSRDQTGEFFDYHRHYAQAAASLLPAGDPLAARARWLVANSSVPQMTTGFMYVHDLLYADPATVPQPPTAMNTAYYAPGIGQAYMRSGWGNGAAWMNVTAGPYTESHAHRDQGSFLMHQGEWLAYDPNYHSHSGIEQEETLHNLVRITSGGQTVRQWEGGVSTMQAVQQGNGWVHVACDTTPVYRYRGDPPVNRVQREWVWIDPGVVIVFDRVTTDAGTQQVWQLNSPVAPVVNGATATFTNGGHSLAVRRVIPAAATTSTFDWRTAGFSGGYRLDETVSGGTNTFLHVLSFGTTVTSTTRSDSGGRQGVQVNLSDGRVVTVRFSVSGVDGTLEIRNAAGAVVVNAPLNPGVRTLPE